MEGVWGENIPLPGYDFIFFLHAMPELGVYKILNGYALQGQLVTPLDEADIVFQQSTANQLITHIEKKLSIK